MPVKAKRIVNVKKPAMDKSVKAVPVLNTVDETSIILRKKEFTSVEQPGSINNVILGI